MQSNIKASSGEKAVKVCVFSCLVALAPEAATIRREWLRDSEFGRNDPAFAIVLPEVYLRNTPGDL